ncbi:MAG: polysaccharide biosynthesis/export family protein [Sphingomonadaceae bacterium]
MFETLAKRLLGKLSILLMLVMTAGCATLPSSGPTAAQIKRGAGENGSAPFKIVTISDAMVSDPDLARELPQSEAGRLSVLSAEGPVDRIGPGDVLDIRVYEVGVSLFAGGGLQAGGGFDPSARGQDFGAVAVTEDGNIKLPYVGALHVEGLTTVDVQRMIERGLSGKSQSPQALVSIRENISNVIYVSGDVGRSGKQMLTLARQRVLDAIADAGGARTATADTVVRFSRRGRIVEQRLASITPGGPDDLVLLPGDRIELLKEPRTYTVFGATNKVSQVPFESEQVSLAEAVARVGGPSDSSADPSAVFLFRFQDDPSGTGSEIPVAYRLNMLDPTSYFQAQRFAMRDKDTIYIATAASNQPGKLVQIINQLFTPLILARQLTRK